MLLAQISALTKAREDRKKQEDEVKGIKLIEMILLQLIELKVHLFIFILNSSE